MTGNMHFAKTVRKEKAWTMTFKVLDVDNTGSIRTNHSSRS